MRGEEEEIKGMLGEWGGVRWMFSRVREDCEECMSLAEGRGGLGDERERGERR